MSANGFWSRYARPQCQRYQQYLCKVPSLDLSLDVSRMWFDDAFLERMAPPMERAYDAMEDIEKGAIANPDEHRMVGHYWLRAPERAPSVQVKNEIRSALAAVKGFTAKVHSGRIRPPAAERFTQVLCIGIGGSALGPMFVADALGQPGLDSMQMHFIDNTDPEGIERTLAALGSRLAET